MAEPKERLYKIHFSEEILKIIGLPRGTRLETRTTNAMEAVTAFFKYNDYQIRIYTVNHLELQLGKRPNVAVEYYVYNKKLRRNLKHTSFYDISKIVKKGSKPKDIIKEMTLYDLINQPRKDPIETGDYTELKLVP